MEITPLFNCVSGSVDTDDIEIVSVSNNKYYSVDLCFKCGMNLPFAEIKLQDKGTNVAAKEVFDDATHLGKELETRWNEHPKFKEALEQILNKEEIGHEFSSDDTLADVFNLCRTILP